MIFGQSVILAFFFFFAYENGDTGQMSRFEKVQTMKGSRCSRTMIQTEIFTKKKPRKKKVVGK